MDIGHQLELMRLVTGLKAEGKTIVMVLHDLDLALRFSDRITVMQDGAICTSDTPEEIVSGGRLEKAFRVHIGRSEVSGERHYYFY